MCLLTLRNAKAIQPKLQSVIAFEPPGSSAVNLVSREVVVEVALVTEAITNILKNEVLSKWYNTV